MKVLVSGAGGQVGTELIKRGQALGLVMLPVYSEELDITQHNRVIEYIKSNSPDIVINAAAYTAVDKAEEEAELAFAVNRDGPAYLAEACSDISVPLLHLSTDYVFDGTNQGAYVESDIPNPTTIYGKSKLEGEQAVVNRIEQHIILRVAWVFAASGSNFVRTMLRLGREGDELNVVADQKGAPTWAGDIADVLLTIAIRYKQNENIAWGTYHYIGTPETTWHRFAQTIFREARQLNMLEKVPRVHAISTDQYPTAAERPKNSVLNCQKIQDAFQIQQPDWRIGLRDVLNEWIGQ